MVISAITPGYFLPSRGTRPFIAGPRRRKPWRLARQVPADFRFCFKLPSSLTHERRLEDIEASFDAFLEALSPLQGRLGPLMVQLPRDFGAEELPKLQALLSRWPSDIPCGVEVRHSEFFHKGAAEQELNRLLISQGANRVMLDVRPLFSTSPQGHPGMIKAQGEKPKRPLHVISTGNFPVVRFIGHVDAEINARYFQPWIDRLALWIKQGITLFSLCIPPIIDMRHRWRDGSTMPLPHRSDRHSCLSFPESGRSSCSERFRQATRHVDGWPSSV